MAFLRVSEVHDIRMSDVEVFDNAIRVRIRKAKRRPQGFQAFIAIGNAYSDFLIGFWANFCCPLGSNNFMLPSNEKTPQVPISPGILQKTLKFITGKCNLNQSDYAFHSCKLGATTTASEKGLGQSNIRALGRWRNESMVARYTRLQERKMIGLSKEMFQE